VEASGACGMPVIGRRKPVGPSSAACHPWVMAEVLTTPIGAIPHPHCLAYQIAFGVVLEVFTVAVLASAAQCLPRAHPRC
jgi:hypothetical protein